MKKIKDLTLEDFEKHNRGSYYSFIIKIEDIFIEIAHYHLKNKFMWSILYNDEIEVKENDYYGSSETFNECLEDLKENVTSRTHDLMENIVELNQRLEEIL